MWTSLTGQRWEQREQLGAVPVVVRGGGFDRAVRVHEGRSVRQWMWLSHAVPVGFADGVGVNCERLRGTRIAL